MSELCLRYLSELGTTELLQNGIGWQADPLPLTVTLKTMSTITIIMMVAIFHPSQLITAELKSFPFILKLSLLPNTKQCCSYCYITQMAGL